jgi:hypothetical protein
MAATHGKDGARTEKCAQKITSVMNSQNGIHKLTDSLHPLFQEDALFFNRMKEEWLASTQKSVFWYLSSGLDFHPLKAGFFRENDLPEAEFFIYTDKANVISGLEKLIEKHGLPLKLSDKEVSLQRMIPLKTDFLKCPAFYLEFFDKGNSLKSLLLLECENQEALERFREHSLTVNYLCTVADGCHSASGFKKEDCPMVDYKNYLTVLDEGYWLSDHLPDDARPGFRRVKIIEGWGRYNLFDQTCVLKASLF